MNTYRVCWIPGVAPAERIAYVIERHPEACAFLVSPKHLETIQQTTNGLVVEKSGGVLEQEIWFASEED